MSDIVISTNDSKQEQKPVQNPELEEVMRNALEIEKVNDRLKKALSDREELERATKAIGGRAFAGQASKTPQELADEEAAKLLKVFR